MRKGECLIHLFVEQVCQQMCELLALVLRGRFPNRWLVAVVLLLGRGLAAQRFAPGCVGCASFAAV